MNHISVDCKDLDFEWLLLILEAKNLGINKEEILSFLHNNDAKELIIDEYKSNI